MTKEMKDLEGNPGNEQSNQELRPHKVLQSENVPNDGRRREQPPSAS